MLIQICVALAGLPPAIAQEGATPWTSAWAEAHGSAVRLLAGEPGNGRWSAGLEIRLDPGWMTYWRSPGEAGVAPRLDWAGSRNLAGVQARWPAPRRFDEGGSSTIGYQDGVVLPLVVTPTDPAKPVDLSLTFDYGACRQLCVPAQARLALTLRPGEPGSSNQARLGAAEAAVPVSTAPGGPGALSITAVLRDGSQRLIIETRAPDPADLFVEAPAGWYLGLPQRLPGGEAGRPSFAIPLDGAPGGVAPSGAELVLTLTGSTRAIETAIQIPAQ